MLDEDLADLLHRHWGLRGVTVTALDGGMNSRTWRVEHPGASYVAKQVAATDLPHLAAGCEVAARLAEAGLTTGRPVPTMAGSLVVDDPPMALLEHVVGRELDGVSAEEQRWMADTLAAAHLAAGPTPDVLAADFYGWLGPDAPGLGSRPGLRLAVGGVRAEVDALRVTWSVLHTDPTPEAFIHDDRTGVTGLIDWAGAGRGPVLYDVASAVMYLGGPAFAGGFLDAYRDHGVLASGEWQHLDAFRRFRWAVQAAYFARRIEQVDLTGVAGQADNERGLADAVRGLTGLGVSLT